jgi:6-phosphogluconolactonase
MIETRQKFKSGLELATALAQDVAIWLRAAIVEKDFAVLAVSGGSTPKPFFAALSQLKLEWSKVQITLVDERQVAEDNERSNAKLVKEVLLQNQAAAAQFVPLYQNPNAANLSRFDVVILGIGNDGHTASFFPGGDNLGAALDLDQVHSVIPMNAPGAGEPRLTFTLPRLLAARRLCLHIQGEDKLVVLEKALSGNDQMEMPVRAVLHSPKPTTLYWCP